MFNLIIVDDKKSIREGIIRFINWDSLGFRVVGDFSSATEAIQFIETENVDVLLTDIVMPDVSGLELTRELRNINPDIKVVILSAHEKFEYAQEALKLGVFSYLMKPVNIENIESEFKKLRSVLEDDQVARLLRKEVGASVKEQFLNNIVNHYFTTEDSIIKKSEELGIAFYLSKFCIMRVILNDGINNHNSFDEKSFQLLMNMISYYTEEYLEQYGRVYSFRSNLTDLSVLYFPKELSNVKTNMEILYKDICSNLNIDVFIGISSMSDRILNASNAYQEAGKALEYRIIKKSSPVLIYDELTEFLKGRILITPEVEDIMLNYLSISDGSSLKRYIEGFLYNAYNDNNINIIYDASIEILLIINKFSASNIDHKSREQNDYFTIKSLLQKEDFSEIIDFLINYLDYSLGQIKSNNEQSSNIIVEKVKKYINEHYSEEITLTKLSEVVYVNPTYLCRLFKAKSGENYMDYLTRVRIEHAKELLSDLSLRIYDISDLVGYKSRKYFGKTFKDITNQTPKEYRNSFSGNN
jgi:YesN/AraC family two-component response regulator